MDEMSEALAWGNRRWAGSYNTMLRKRGEQCMIGYEYDGHFHVIGVGKTWREAMKNGEADSSVKMHITLAD